MRAPLIALLLLALATPARLRAQEPVGVIFTPRVGMLAQAAPFKVRFEPSPEFRQTWTHRFRPGPVLGLAAELGLGRAPVKVRAEVSHAPGLTLERDGRLGSAIDRDADSGALTAATLALVMRPANLCRGAVCPRLLAGLGAKWYRFDATVTPDDIVMPFAEDQRHLTLQLGAGVAARLGRARLVLEVSDFSNRFDSGITDGTSRRVHDVTGTLGLEVPVR